MRDWSAQRIAELTGASSLRGSPVDGPCGVSINSREVSPGELFIGLQGERADGGSHFEEALAAGAWGVLVTPRWGEAASAATGGDGAVLVHDDPLGALQALAGARRAELQANGAKVLAITGSTGKTSTKDILAALLAKQRRTVASPQNLNTEIGLPLAILAAGLDTEALVLEMAMRGPGQIAELTQIADPDVGIIVNVGPAHLELLGSLEAIAAAKAELLAGLRAGGTAVVPAGEALLEPHLRDDLELVTFGPGGDVSLRSGSDNGVVTIDACGERVEIEPSFRQAHNLRNLLAAVAAARAVGVQPDGRLDVEFSAMRGQRIELARGITLVEDCYNANPMSMRAALDELAQSGADRRVAVLGDMLELGAEAAEHHRDLARHAASSGVSLLVTVGALAQTMAGSFDGDVVSVADAAAAAARVPGLLEGGETVLVKGSRGVRLELVAAALREAFPPRRPAPGRVPASAASDAPPGGPSEAAAAAHRSPAAPGRR